MKQSLFAILEPVIRDRAFLDLFAGSGAGGIEALSRGARSAVFVERDRAAAQTVERNLRSAGLLGPRATIAPSEAIAWLHGGARDAGDFAAILIDPPYDRPDLLDSALAAIATAGPGGTLAADGVVVAKHFRKAAPPARVGLLRSARQERFGETVLTFYRWSTGGDGEEDG